MGLTVAQKLIQSHLVSGEMTPGAEVGLRIDQTLTQDATGTMAYLEFEAPLPAYFEKLLDRLRKEAAGKGR